MYFTSKFGISQIQLQLIDSLLGYLYCHCNSCYLLTSINMEPNSMNNFIWKVQPIMYVIIVVKCRA